jgi:hypothetical protein
VPAAKTVGYLENADEDGEAVTTPVASSDTRGPTDSVPLTSIHHLNEAQLKDKNSDQPSGDAPFRHFSLLKVVDRTVTEATGRRHFHKATYISTGDRLSVGFSDEVDNDTEDSERALGENTAALFNSLSFSELGRHR